jgi:YVTN family beta-propeller protein
MLKSFDALSDAAAMGMRGRSVLAIPVTLLVAVFLLVGGSVPTGRATGIPDSFAGSRPAAPAATQPVADYVSAIVVDPLTGDVYVANWDSSNVTILNGSSGAVIAHVPVGLYPDALVLDSSHDLFVANSGSNNVSVISTTTHALAATVPVGVQPCALAFSTDSREVYVANIGSGTVSVIDPSTDTVVASLPVGYGDDAIASGLPNGDLVVGQWWGSDQATLISTASNTIVATVPTPGHNPWSLAVDPPRDEVYAPLNGSGTDTVGVIDGATDQLVFQIPVGDGPRAVAYDVSNGETYVANLYTNNVSVVDDSTHAVVATVPVGIEPWVVAVDSVRNLVYVANHGSDNVSVINGTTNSVVRTVATGSEPSAIAIDTVNGVAFVSNYGSANVTTIGPPSIHVPPTTGGSSTWVDPWVLGAVAAIGVAVVVVVLWVLRTKTR